MLHNHTFYLVVDRKTCIFHIPDTQTSWAIRQVQADLPCCGCGCGYFVLSVNKENAILFWESPLNCNLYLRSLSIRKLPKNTPHIHFLLRPSNNIYRICSHIATDEQISPPANDSVKWHCFFRWPFKRRAIRNMRQNNWFEREKKSKMSELLFSKQRLSLERDWLNSNSSQWAICTETEALAHTHTDTTICSTFRIPDTM